MRSNFYWIIALLAISCGSNNNQDYHKEVENKLPANLVQNSNTLDSSSRSKNAMGRLEWKDSLHDFGRIKEGEQIEYEFEYKNVGNADLLIYSATASCGCTVPEYNRETPTKPNETGTLKVKFNSEGKKGHNIKSIMVKTNGNPSEYNIAIVCNVD